MVGFTQLYPLFSSVQTARTWLLNDLYVDAARAAAARAAHCSMPPPTSHATTAPIGIDAGDRQDNAPARALYRAAGWHEEATQWYSLALR